MKSLPGKATQIEHWPIERLRPYENNARTHSDEQVAQIAASMAEFGFTNPVLVDAGDGIIAGHGRLQAAKRLGLDTVPVVVLDYLTDAQRRAYILADNRLAESAGWDEAILAEELARLADEDFDVSLIGFTDDELADLLPDDDDIDAGGDGTPRCGDDDVPDAELVPVSREGDLWRLGKHRLLCGDSTSGEALALLLDGKQADCLWTDPPYNVNYEGGAGKILNDHMGDEQFHAFLGAVFQNAAAHMRDGGPAYIAHADGGAPAVAFRTQFMEAGFHLASCLIWRKNTFTLGRGDYHWQHEPILYGWKKGAAHIWHGDRTKTTVMDDEHQLVTKIGDNQYQINLGETGLVITGDNLSLEAVKGSVLVEEKPKRNSDHPTMKPVALIERMLRNSAARGDIVLDLFGGSGSTMIACEKLGMSARLMELDARFVDVIVRRWQEFTGRVARLEGTDETFEQVEDRRGGGSGTDSQERHDDGGPAVRRDAGEQRRQCDDGAGSVSA